MLMTLCFELSGFHHAVPACVVGRHVQGSACLPAESPRSFSTQMSRAAETFENPPKSSTADLESVLDCVAFIPASSPCAAKVRGDRGAPRPHLPTLALIQE